MEEIIFNVTDFFFFLRFSCPYKFVPTTVYSFPGPIRPAISSSSSSAVGVSVRVAVGTTPQ